MFLSVDDGIRSRGSHSKRMADQQHNTNTTTTDPEATAKQPDERSSRPLAEDNEEDFADEVFRRKSSSFSQRSKRSLSPSPTRKPRRQRHSSFDARQSKRSPLPPEAAAAATAAVPKRSSTLEVPQQLQSSVRRFSEPHSSRQQQQQQQQQPPPKKAQTMSASSPEPTKAAATAESQKSTQQRSSQSSGSPLESPSKPMKYTSIDLENDLPEMYSSSLNPAIEDPDMSEFFSRAPPFCKARSPPPVYISRKASSVSSMQPTPRKGAHYGFEDKGTRMKLWLALFIVVFFVFPIVIILVFRVLPSLTAAFGSKE